MDSNIKNYIKIGSLVLILALLMLYGLTGEIVRAGFLGAVVAWFVADSI